jgi:peptide-methionine (S)-S-oxide reductase
VKLAAVAAMVLMVFAPVRAGSVLPNSKLQGPAVTTSNSQIAVFAGGCFWGVDAVFKHVKGVSEVE